MTSPIRVLHFADSHIGMENYGKTDPASGLSSRVVDFLRRMDEIVEYAREHEVDLTIFAGDAFKTRNPNPTFQREFAHRIRDLSLLAPIVLLVGNHDLPPSTLKASSIEIYDTLQVPNVWVAYDYEGRVIDTKRGPVYVATAPYPIRARLLERLSTTGHTIAQTDELLQTELTRVLEALATEADQHAMPRLLTGHFTVGGAVVGSERGIMLGRDIAVSKTSIADDRWDYVALGHIHKHQNLTVGRIDAPPVVYSGSIERIDFGEEGDPKGFCWVELDRDATEWRFVELSARPFITLKADLRRSHNPTQDALLLIDKHRLHQAVVRMIVQFTPESEARFNELAIRNAIHQAGAFYFAALKKEVEQPIRARLGANPEGLTPPELLERYLISKQIDETRRVDLLEAADSIFNIEGPER
ncbi:MAG: exonuclease SbcCD subunit D [Anaerolineae bacterium]|jgi:exonuclease SbcD|nr:exonuclease SbcCD subunit D [Anaerolineae bacterium]